MLAVAPVIDCERNRQNASQSAANKRLLKAEVFPRWKLPTLTASPDTSRSN
jgi:hypothetical protein